MFTEYKKKPQKMCVQGFEYLVYEKPTEMPFSENGLSANGFSETEKRKTEKGVLLIIIVLIMIN